MTQLQWLNDESQLRQVVYGELDDRSSDLFAHVRPIDGGFALLRFLKSNANTLRTVDDIAYYMHQTVPTVEKGLRAMQKLELVRRVEAGGVTWFGITRDPDRRRSVNDLCAWQDRWRTRLAQIDQVINGKSVLPPEVKGTLHPELKQVTR